MPATETIAAVQAPPAPAHDRRYPSRTELQAILGSELLRELESLDGTVYVAMSGGVDSSAVAALLHGLGLSVVGISLRLYNPAHERTTGFESAPEFGSCCSLDDLAVARRQAMDIGIAHYTLDMVREFRESVFDYFVQQYAQGRTPSPCVKCNDSIKFSRFFDVLDGPNDIIVTGHYARVEPAAEGLRLLRGVDPVKDQSYSLARTPQDALRRVRFPLGGLAKTQVRELSRAMGLRSAEKKDSQDLCFVGGQDTGEFVEKHLDRVRTGRFVDLEGKVLGEHHGVHRYTPGQRKGLGIAHSEPLYVRQILSGGDVQLGTRQQLSAREFTVREPVWVSGRAPQRSQLAAQVRYRSAAEPAEIVAIADDGTLRVRMQQPIFAPAPGQLVALYDQDQVLGGGFLDQVDWSA